MKANVTSLWMMSVAMAAIAISGCSSDTPIDVTVDSGHGDAGIDLGQAVDMAVLVDQGAPDMVVVVDMGTTLEDMAVPVDMPAVVDAGPPECGNDVIEGAEECDDGNTGTGDGCDASCQSEEIRTGYRITSLSIKDPHAFANVGVCIDVTSALNGQLDTNITGDSNTDDLYDLSIALSFLPLDPSAVTSNVQVSFPDCNVSTNSCHETVMDPTPHAGIATNMSTGTCLTPVSGTTRSSYGDIALPEGPCFSTNFGTTSFDVSGITLTLRDTRFAAEYSGAPASMLVTGLVQGFLSEADAEATTIPSSVTLVGGMPLSALLPGGAGCCRSGSTNDDRDTFTDGVTRGWYFYMAFTAETVPYTAL